MIKLVAIALASAFALGATAEPSPFVAVYDDSIAAGQAQRHLDALAAFKLAKVETDYAASYAFYRMDNGRIPALHPVGTLEFSAAENAAWEAMKRPFDADFLAANGEVYEQTIVAQEFYVMRLMPELSYRSDFDVADYPYLHWQELDVIGNQPGRSLAIKALTEMRELDTKMDSALRYRVYRKQHGPNLPVFTVLHYAKSAEDLERSLAQAKALRGDRGEALRKTLSRHTQVLSSATGTFISDVSY